LTVVKPIRRQQPVGIEQPLEKVIDLLDMTSTDVLSLAVVVCGYGGIGKTTLAKAVVARLNLKGNYNYSSVEMDNLLEKNELVERNGVRRLQQQILMDAFPNYNFAKQKKLKHSQEGRDHLTKAFKCEGNKPVFILIDNCQREKDLTELLPEDLKGLPRRSRILLTTRNWRETDMLQHGGLQRRKYRVQNLPKEEARKILMKEPIDVDINSMEDVLQRILKVCYGIPLVLKMVGACLMKHNYRIKECTQILDALENIKEQDLSERAVDFVYSQLEEPTQDAFLDICWFFNNWNRRYVEYIVGTEHLQSLEEAALVSSTFAEWEEELSSRAMKLNVHDVIRAKGRSMSEGSRITNVESFEEAKQDEGMLHKIKGLWLMEDHTKTINDIYTKSEDIEQSGFECHVEERYLNLMSKSLRVLALGDHVSVRGRSNMEFQELRYLQIGSDIPVRLEAQNKLAAYYGPLFKEDVKLPKNIQMLKAKRQWEIDGEVKPIKAVSDCGLKELNLIELGDMQSTTSVPLEEQFIPLLEVSSLKFLILDQCKSLQFLLGSAQLGSLFYLSLVWDGSLKKLPSTFDQLRSLRILSLFGCSKLEELPSTFGQLNSLHTLDLFGCCKLKELPSTFGQLSSLKNLYLSNCTKLKELPATFSQLSSLQVLDLRFCCKLEELPFNFGELKSLQTLDLCGCSKLEELPSNFSQLSSLRHLYLDDCPKLLNSPSTVFQLKTLESLHMIKLPYREITSQNWKYLWLSSAQRWKEITEFSSRGNVKKTEVLIRVELFIGNKWRIEFMTGHVVHLAQGKDNEPSNSYVLGDHANPSTKSRSYVLAGQSDPDIEVMYILADHEDPYEDERELKDPRETYS
ncbi:hypothetical protein KI387_035731, partial [Taxus chinensis]